MAIVNRATALVGGAYVTWVAPDWDTDMSETIGPLNPANYTDFFIIGVEPAAGGGGGGGPAKVLFKAVNYPVTVDDLSVGVLILYMETDTAGNDLTVTLPTPVQMNDLTNAYQILVYNLSMTGIYKTTLVRPGAQTINGIADDWDMNNPLEVRRVTSDGVNNYWALG